MSTTAVITGGSDGIGYAIAEPFVQAGIDVVIVARDEEKLSSAARLLSNHQGDVATIVADLSESNAAEFIADRVRDVTDTVDVLVNNVGVAHFSPLADTSDEGVDAMLYLNGEAPLAITRPC